MYRFALRPRWLLSHLFVLALVVTLVNLGFWQLRRLDERRDRNDEVSARSEAAPVEVTALADEDPDQIRYRSVSASGRYLAESTFLVDNRSLDGRPGAWAVTPLELDDGSLLAVNRGFVAVGASGDAVAPPPPEGPVEVVGTVSTYATRRCAVRADRDRAVAGASCLSIQVAETAGGAGMLAVVLQAAASDPVDAPSLSPVPLPEPGDGPHLGYAVQWFLFASVAVVGYPLILRKNARERRPSPIDVPA